MAVICWHDNVYKTAVSQIKWSLKKLLLLANELVNMTLSG